MGTYNKWKGKTPTAIINMNSNSSSQVMRKMKIKKRYAIFLPVTGKNYILVNVVYWEKQGGNGGFIHFCEEYKLF
jgi:hypothetical protein